MAPKEPTAARVARSDVIVQDQRAMDFDRRRYVALHTVDTTQAINALVAWNGKDWTVTVNDEVLPDCCETIEAAFTAAELEIMRRAPNHTCQECKPWQPWADA